MRTFVEDRWASEEHRRPEMMTSLLDLQAARVDAHKATQSNRAVRGRTYFINCFGAPRMCAVQRGLGRRHCRQSCCLHRRNPLTHSPQPYSKTHTYIYIYIGKDMITLGRMASRPWQQQHVITTGSRSWGRSPSTRSCGSRPVPPTCVCRRPLQTAFGPPKSNPSTVKSLLLQQTHKRSFSHST